MNKDSTVVKGKVADDLLRSDSLKDPKAEKGTFLALTALNLNAILPLASREFSVPERRIPHRSSDLNFFNNHQYQSSSTQRRIYSRITQVPLRRDKTKTNRYRSICFRDEPQITLG